MLDHLSLQADDLDATCAFYDAVLAPLGSTRLLSFGDVAGYGVDGPILWIGRATTPGPAREMHVAFAAADRAAVDAFHAAAVATGAEVLNAPAVREEYHPNYYAAFVRDPDGNNVEAVCHRPAE